VRRLDAHAATAFAPNPHPLNGVTVYHASTIRGGSDYATYPAQVSLGIEIGTQPGETIDERVHEIEAIFEAIQRDVPDFQARVDVRLHRPPFEAHGHERLWDALDDASRAVTGNALQPAGQNAWGDAGLTSAAGIPTLYLGASGGNFHAADEWVDVDELVALSEILVRAAEGYLRGGDIIQQEEPVRGAVST
jgi:acetylornithine deacetylase